MFICFSSKHYKAICGLWQIDGYSPILMIKTDDTLVFVNSKEDGEIEGLYGELSL